MAQTLNTVHIDLRPDWRGGQYQAWLLLRGLAARGHRVRLLTCRGSALAPRVRRAGFPVEEISPPFTRWRAARRLRELLRREPCNIVHAHEAHAHTALWLAGAAPAVARIVSRRVVFPPRMNWLSRRKYRRGLDRYLAVSREVRGSLEKTGLANVSVVYDGVDVPSLPSPADRQRARAALGLASDSLALACLGTLEPAKGQFAAVEALPVIRQTLPAQLLIAGDGPLRPQLASRVRGMGLDSAVRFLGYVDDLHAFFAATDVFLFLALDEGLGTSLLLAMAHRLPVIALEATAAAEVVEDGKSGRLIHSARPEALAGAVLYLARHPDEARGLAANARATISQRFTADRMVEETLAVYQAVLHERRSAR